MSGLYDAIFYRKSVRKYTKEPLGQKEINDINEYIKTVKPLDHTINYEVSLLGADEVKNLLPVKAPHYLCFYSETKEHSYTNAGYILQQIDLYLSSKGLGSCWLGMAKPSKGVPLKKGDLDFVIILAFGNSEEEVHRKSVSEFKRNSLSQITNINQAEELLEPVRLAPSATNSQPWYFSGNKREIVVSREKLGIVKVKIYNTMNQIDIGIALCHLVLSLENMGKKATFSYEPVTVPKNYNYMVTVNCT